MRIGTHSFPSLTLRYRTLVLPIMLSALVPAANAAPYREEMVSGTVTNIGTREFLDILYVKGDATITGPGRIVLNNTHVRSNYLAYPSQYATLTIGAGQTLTGSGQVSVPLILDHQATLLIDQGATARFGSIVATNGGVVQVADSAQFSPSFMRGGTLEILGSGEYAFASSNTLFDVTLVGRQISLASRSELRGTITTAGSLVVNNRLHLYANTTLSGSGRTVLNQGAVEANSNLTLTIAQGHTLAGHGVIRGIYGRFDMVNRGTVEVDQGRMLDIHQAVDNRDGLIRVGEGAFLHSRTSVKGGEIEGLGGGGFIQSEGGVYEDVRLSGKLSTQGNVALGGTITNQGSLSVNGNALVLRSDTTLAGGGETVLNNGFIDSQQGHRLTVSAGHTLRGAGNVGGYLGYSGVEVLNQGTILADLPSRLLNIHGNFTNQGVVQVAAGSTMAFLNGAKLTQDQGGARIVVDGVLSTPSIELQAGALSGTGTIRGQVNNTGGQVNPGASPGKLSIEGDYTQSADGDLLIELNGTAQGSTYDWLAITGLASLGGDLYLTLGYSPAEGDTFTFLTSGGGINGTFDHVHVSSGWNATTTYTGHNLSVTLTAAVPEPRSIVLMLTGLAMAGGMAAVKRRRSS